MFSADMFDEKSPSDLPAVSEAPRLVPAPGICSPLRRDRSHAFSRASSRVRTSGRLWHARFLRGGRVFWAGQHRAVLPNRMPVIGQ